MSIFWPDRLSKDIAADLKANPSDWKEDGAWILNDRRGCQVWIANASYALEVKFYGGPTRYGFFFPIGTASQIWIWWAYKKWRDDRAPRLWGDQA